MDIVVPQDDVPVPGSHVEDLEEVVPLGFRYLEQLQGHVAVPVVVVEGDPVFLHGHFPQRIRDHQEEVEIRVEALLQAIGGSAVFRLGLGLAVAVDPFVSLQEADGHQLPQFIEDEAVFAGVAELLRHHVFLPETDVGIGHHAVLDMLRGQPVIPPAQDGVVGGVFHEGFQLVDVFIGVEFQPGGAGHAAAPVGENDALVLKGGLFRQLGGIEDEAVRRVHVIGGFVVVVVVPSPLVGLLHLGSLGHGTGHRSGLFHGFDVGLPVLCPGLRLQRLVPHGDIDRDVPVCADGDIAHAAHGAGDDGGGVLLPGEGLVFQGFPDLRRVGDGDGHVPLFVRVDVAALRGGDDAVFGQVFQGVVDVLRGGTVDGIHDHPGFRVGRSRGLLCGRGLIRLQAAPGKQGKAEGEDEEQRKDNAQGPLGSMFRIVRHGGPSFEK